MNRKGFYLRMAGSNIIKNGKFYFPFIGVSALSVAMLYAMSEFLYSDTLPGGGAVRSLMQFGTAVIAFFCVIFTFYTNGFLIRRRMKELGVYTIMGMEKKHIARIVFWENALSFVFSVVPGLLFGMLFDKLLYMLLSLMLDADIGIEYAISSEAIALTALVFLGIFTLVMLWNLFKTLRVNPIDLMSGSKKGEAEPKVKWPIAVGGALCLGAGYYLALNSTDTYSALTWFFVAVILVIIGTYLLFGAGTMAVLKLLKNNKKFYYNKNHFSTVSGMFYRMKQNAAGLANICILSTMVIVTISTTLSLNVGFEDIIRQRYPSRINIDLIEPSDVQRERLVKIVDEAQLDTGIFMNGESEPFEYFEVTSVYKGEDFRFGFYQDGIMCIIAAYTVDNFKNSTKVKVEVPALKEGEVAVAAFGIASDINLPETMNFYDKTYKVVPIEMDAPDGKMAVYAFPVYYMVFPDDASYNAFFDLQYKEYSESEHGLPSTKKYTYYLDGNISDENEIKLCEEIDSRMKAEFSDDVSSFSCSSRVAQRESNRGFYGGFLFLGIYLGSLFTMYTVISMYYKQLVEGYDDRERFRIMQNVGMSKEEVKKTIRTQVLSLFFMPLIVAAIHTCFAFPLLKYLLSAFALNNVTLFALCTLATFAVYALVYGVVYAVTAKTYYKIVT